MAYLLPGRTSLHMFNRKHVFRMEKIRRGLETQLECQLKPCIKPNLTSNGQTFSATQRCHGT